MSCGCTSACGCIIVGDGVTAEVARVGDTFTVSSIQAVRAAIDTPCVDLSINPDKELSAELILDAAPASVDLECTPDGLRAEVVPDPASTAIVSVGPGGLRVDVPPPAAGSFGPQPGDLVWHGGIGLRPGAIDADGAPVLRDDYPALHDALSLKATDADRSAGVAQITGIPSTRFIAPGMIVEATGFPFGTTVVSVDSSTAITLSAPADDSGSETEVRVYPWGNGDGLTTFNTPQVNDAFPLGYDYQTGARALGSSGGAHGVPISVNNVPPHDHDAIVTDPGHGHPASSVDSGHGHPLTITSDGAHLHYAGATGNPASDFVTIENPVSAADFISIPTEAGIVGGGGSTTQTVSVPTFPSTDPSKIDYQMGNRAGTSTEGTHDHPGSSVGSGTAAISTTVTAAGTGITVDVQPNVSTTEDLEVTPPFRVGRWMVVV